ncbi:MAG: tetratricopeptide repeat protein [Deltaproteobacteria bacterium]|nr:tetratricopeptide repeat protein [Deltaproteobacteria bacterium]
MTQTAHATSDVQPRQEHHEQTPGERTASELLARIAELTAQNAWGLIVETFHPLAEKYPAADADPKSHSILSGIAFAFSQLHRFDEALALLAVCLERCPGYYRYLSSVAFNCYNALMADKSREIKLGDRRQSYFTRAEAAFIEAEKAFPQGVVDFYRHGMLYHHLSTMTDRKAVPLFLKAIENWEAMGPEARQDRHKDFKNYVKALYHLAKAYLNLGEPDKAIDAIGRCLREDDTTHHEEAVHKFYIAGKAHMATGDHDGAVKFLRVAAHQKTRRPKDYIYEAIARCLLQLGEHETARGWIERIPAQYRKPYVLRLQATILARSGNLAGACEQFKQALKRDRQGRHKTLYAWGVALFQDKQYARALELFMQANQEKRKGFATEYANAVYMAGKCHAALSDTTAAADAYRRALAIDSRHSHAAGALDRMGIRPGNTAPAPADEEWEQLLRMADGG